jgi:hypothetical protein
VQLAAGRSRDFAREAKRRVAVRRRHPSDDYLARGRPRIEAVADRRDRDGARRAMQDRPADAAGADARERPEPSRADDDQVRSLGLRERVQDRRRRALRHGGELRSQVGIKLCTGPVEDRVGVGGDRLGRARRDVGEAAVVDIYDEQPARAGLGEPAPSASASSAVSEPS